MDLNLSFTTPAFDDLDAGLTRPPFFIKLIVEGLPPLAAAAPDPTEVTFYAAAGNQSVNSKFFPASFDGVVSVAALDPAGRWVRWDDHGNEVALEDDQLSAWIRDSGGLAPGCDLVGIGHPRSDSVTIWSGSSFAAPIALVLDDGVSTPAHRLSDYDELGIDSPLLASSSAVLAKEQPQCEPPGLACQAALLWCGDTWLTWWQWMVGLAVVVVVGGEVFSRFSELRRSDRSGTK